MGADKFNGSGCFDETAYKVMRREKRKKRLSLVYICSRYAGDVEKNVDAAKKYCRFALNQNVVPLAPHLLYPRFMDDSKEQDMDLWAEFRLLDMGQRLGRYIGQYRRDFFIPDKRNQQIIFSYKPVAGAEAC